jgi:LPXTG-site transpeptidase (sortase) family protein
MRAMFIWSGLALCTAFALAEVDGALGRADAIDRFMNNPPPDQSNWSAQRRRDYAASIGLPHEMPVALLTIDTLELQVPVFPHDDELSLNRGSALIPGMAGPDQGGNLGIAGHRDGHFRVLQDIQPGDIIRIRTHRDEHRYRVTAIHIVDLDDNRLLGDSGLPTVTLVTCYPFYFVGNAPQRFVVTGEYLWNDQT